MRLMLALIVMRFTLALMSKVCFCFCDMNAHQLFDEIPVPFSNFDNVTLFSGVLSVGFVKFGILFVVFKENLSYNL